MVLNCLFFVDPHKECPMVGNFSICETSLISCFLQSEDSNEASFLRELTLINDIDRGKIYKKCIYLQSLMTFPMLTYLRTMGAQRFSANN